MAVGLLKQLWLADRFREQAHSYRELGVAWVMCSPLGLGGIGYFGLLYRKALLY